jgi:hypothetical protein
MTRHENATACLGSGAERLQSVHQLALFAFFSICPSSQVCPSQRCHRSHWNQGTSLPAPQILEMGSPNITFEIILRPPVIHLAGLSQMLSLLMTVMLHEQCLLTGSAPVTQRHHHVQVVWKLFIGLQTPSRIPKIPCVHTKSGPRLPFTRVWISRST